MLNKLPNVLDYRIKSLNNDLQRQPGMTNLYPSRIWHRGCLGVTNYTIHRSLKSALRKANHADTYKY